MCFEKNYADFFVSTFHGEVPGKSASFNWVTWFNWAIRSGRYLSLGRQLVQKRGKLSNIDPD